MRKASKRKDVPFNTIRYHLKYDRKGKTEIIRGRNREFSDSEERDLANYAKYVSELGFPFTRKKVLKSLIVDILKCNGRKTVTNLEQGLTDIWVRNFLTVLVKPNLLQNARAEVKQTQIVIISFENILSNL